MRTITPTQPDSIVLLDVPDLTIAVSPAGLEVCQGQSSFILRYPLEWLNRLADDIRVALEAEVPPIYRASFVRGKTCLIRITTEVFDISFFELEGIVRYSVTLSHVQLWQLSSKLNWEVARGSVVGMIALPEYPSQSPASQGVQIPLPL